MIDRSALEALLAGADPAELFAIAGEIQGRAFAAVTQANVTPPPGRKVSVKEAARELGCSADWIYHNQAELPFVRRLGRRVVIDLAAAEAWMDAGHGR